MPFGASCRFADATQASALVMLGKSGINDPFDLLVGHSGTPSRACARARVLRRKAHDMPPSAMLCGHLHAIRFRPRKPLIVHATAGQAQLLAVAEGFHRIAEASLRNFWIAAGAS
jgi:hypothetical protein